MSKAFDSIGHAHLCSTINSSNLPLPLKHLLINLLVDNVIRIHVGGERIGKIRFNRGFMQEDAVSPILFNLSINHILDEVSERSIAETYGYSLSPETEPLTVLCFADDIVLIGKDTESVSTLVTLVISLLQEIGLSINSEKSKAILINKGRLDSGVIKTVYGDITGISAADEVKYLGVTFNQALIFNSEEILHKLNNNLNMLSSTHLLQPHKKLLVINQFIAPSLVYPFQTALVDKIPKPFLSKADKLIRSSVKEILQLPHDKPNSMIYTNHKYKGLSIMKASWEAFLQQ